MHTVTEEVHSTPPQALQVGHPPRKDHATYSIQPARTPPPCFPLLHLHQHSITQDTSCGWTQQPHAPPPRVCPPPPRCPRQPAPTISLRAAATDTVALPCVHAAFHPPAAVDAAPSCHCRGNTHANHCTVWFRPERAGNLNLTSSPLARVQKNLRTMANASFRVECKSLQMFPPIKILHLRMPRSHTHTHTHVSISLCSGLHGRAARAS